MSEMNEIIKIKFFLHKLTKLTNLSDISIAKRPIQSKE